MGPQPSRVGGLPRAEYTARLAARRATAAFEARREQIVGTARLAVFVAGLAVAGLAFGGRLFSPWWLVVPVVVSVALLLVHERVTRAWRRARRAAGFYETGLARLDFAWQGKGQSGVRFQDEKHPYAADLDLFGKGSLFELLCTARTRGGEDVLAGWLSAPAEPAEVRARQEAVAELRPMLDLREELALLAGDVPPGVDFEAVAAWGAAAPVLQPRWLQYVALVLGVCTTTTFVIWVLPLLGLSPAVVPGGAFLAEFGIAPFATLLLIQLGFSGWHGDRVRQVLAAVEGRAWDLTMLKKMMATREQPRGPEQRRGARDLALLAHLLARLEQTDFASARLRELRATLDASADGSATPSRRIVRLTALLELLDSRRNPLFAPFAYLLMWGTQTAYAIEAWRAASGPAVASWLRVVGQFEALCSLASYGYENPDDPFPEIIDGPGVYEGTGLGHPLLPAATAVRNDLRLGPDQRVLVVSGSNMSGKSTFLRTVGVNAVLAQAGSPVRATRLRLSSLAVGATLRIQDSLQEGRSRFYAELLRVKQVVELSRGKLPLLFLLDEVFAGTNSHDRRLGAEAVVRGLVEAGAIGLVTTHDLSLTHIAEQLTPRAANVHFADHFEDGVMKFDYRMHEGVVNHSNALALMRAVGLEV